MRWLLASRDVPLMKLMAHRQEGLSQLGGFPEWIQGSSYPHCPLCKETMLFLGQISPVDLNHNAEGMFYAFLCAPCGKAATTFQAT